MPEFQNLGEEGDQIRIWNLSQIFLDDLQERLGTQVCQSEAGYPSWTGLREHPAVFEGNRIQLWGKGSDQVEISNESFDVVQRVCSD